MSDEAPKTKVLSLEEIKVGLSEMATHGEGAQRTQAYRMLMSMGQTEAVLPPPLEDKEVQHRLARMMRGAGLVNTRYAFLKAFPRRMSPDRAATKYDDVDIGIPKDVWPKTLKKLYAMCPELKGPGFPKGYPINKGVLAQQEWVRMTFYKYHVTKQADKRHATLMELEVATDHADEDARDHRLDPAAAGFVPADAEDQAADRPAQK